MEGSGQGSRPPVLPIQPVRRIEPALPIRPALPIQPALSLRPMAPSGSTRRIEPALPIQPSGAVQRDSCGPRRRTTPTTPKATDTGDAPVNGVDGVQQKKASGAVPCREESRFGQECDSGVLMDKTLNNRVIENVPEAPSLRHTQSPRVSVGNLIPCSASRRLPRYSQSSGSNQAGARKRDGTGVLGRHRVAGTPRGEGVKAAPDAVKPTEGQGLRISRGDGAYGRGDSEGSESEWSKIGPCKCFFRKTKYQGGSGRLCCLGLRVPL